MFLINYRNVGYVNKNMGAHNSSTSDNIITSNNNCPSTIMHEASNSNIETKEEDMHVEEVD